MRERICHPFLRNRIKGNAVGGDVLQRPFFRENFLEMPGNRLSFAIRVSCDVEVFSPFQFFSDGIQMLLSHIIHLPSHRKTFLRPNGPILGDQISHMAIACEDAEIFPKVFLNRFSLRGRFHNDDIHARFHSSFNDILAPGWRSRYPAISISRIATHNSDADN